MDKQKLIDKLKSNNIEFTKHFDERVKERPISRELVIKYIRIAILLKFEKQESRKNEEKYKLWLKMSNRYCLVIILSISEKGLNIISGWNKEGKWKK